MQRIGYVPLSYSQNFLKSMALVQRLIHQSGFAVTDTIIEIGTGNGLLTHELAKVFAKVISYEADAQLAAQAKARFQSSTSVQIILQDFLAADLPKHQYKVFANIPSSLTSRIIRKLTEAENPPSDAFLILQKEAAEKFVGAPVETQASMLLKLWFDTKIVYAFNRPDFAPAPHVDCVLMHMHRRPVPLISDETLYKDFIVYFSNQNAKKLRQVFRQYLFKPSMLDALMTDSKKLVKGAFQKHRLQEESLNKIYRTRLAKNWRGKRAKIEL